MKLIEKRVSEIHGHGVFATGYITTGQLLINWLKDSEIITRSKYSPNNQTAVRLVGNLFIDGERDDTDFINHSFDPNCVYLLGLVFAKVDIDPGTELTVDYSHFLPQDEKNVTWGTSAVSDVLRQAGYLLLNWQDLRVL